LLIYIFLIYFIIFFYFFFYLYILLFFYYLFFYIFFLSFFSWRLDLKDGLALYNSENNIGLRNAWNIIQAEWKCCGVIAYTDWHEALKEKVVPDRCCQEHYQNCGRNSTNMFWNRVSFVLRFCFTASHILAATTKQTPYNDLISFRNNV
uniref:Uncharacterized protein n=1 Tax=Periophthalmus magnuspinnatus TaxID=409849 RepID=A0A3B4B726_9GOBI